MMEQAPLPLAPQPAPAVPEPAAAAPLEPVAPPPAPAAPAPMLELPQITRTPPPDSGLELVETRHHAPAPVAEEPEPARPKRVRPPRAQVVEEPLQIVETRKEPSPPAA